MRKEHFYIVATSGALALLYLVGTNRCYPIVDDALPFALHVHAGSTTLVHHLFIDVLAALNRLLGFTAPQDVPGTLWLFRTYVAGTSFLSLAVIGVMSLEWFGSLRAALVTILVTGFAHAYWLYSTITDFPIPATAFTLLAVYLAARSYRYRRPYVMLLLASLSVLVAALNHQSHSIVVLPIAVVLLLWQSRRWTLQHRLVRSGFFVVVTAVLGLTTFYSSYLRGESETDFVTFVRGYEAKGKAFPSDRLQWATPAYAAMGISRALFYPEYALYLDGAFARASAHYPYRLLSKYRYALRALPQALIVALLLTTGLLLAAWTLFALRAILHLRKRPPPHPAFWMVLGWMVIQGLFSAWWLATSREFWAWMIPCMNVVGVGLVMQSFRPTARRLVPVLLVAILFVTNLPALATLWSSSNCLYGINKSYLARLDKIDLAITPYLYSISELTALQPSPAPVFTCHLGALSFDDADLSSALQKVRREGGRVFVDPIMVMPEQTEIHRLRLNARTNREAVERELLRLESFCKTQSIPLYAVRRDSDGVVAYTPCRFEGYAKWTDAGLNVVDSPSHFSEAPGGVTNP